MILRREAGKWHGPFYILKGPICFWMENGIERSKMEVRIPDRRLLKGFQQQSTRVWIRGRGVGRRIGKKQVNRNDLVTGLSVRVREKEDGYPG